MLAVREYDGMNQLGTEGGRRYNLQPYADYTGYYPVNAQFSPNASGRSSNSAYIQQAAEVIQASASLTEEQKNFQVGPGIKR